MMPVEDEELLKRELVGLFGHLARMRRELAALQATDAGSGDFASMADTLDAIVENTETASNTILESMEAIDHLAIELRNSEDPRSGEIADGISDRVNQVFEACSFQDLTGQRITRVVNSLKFVEERINAMVRMWGKDELAKTVEEVRDQGKPTDEEQALLHGPQRTGVAISQSDVDKLFSQDDIDKMFD